MLIKPVKPLFNKLQNADLPNDLSIKLYQHIVLPILKYGSGIYGYENLDILEFSEKFNVTRQKSLKMIKNHL